MSRSFRRKNSRWLSFTSPQKNANVFQRTMITHNHSIKWREPLNTFPLLLVLLTGVFILSTYFVTFASGLDCPAGVGCQDGSYCNETSGNCVCQPFFRARDCSYLSCDFNSQGEDDDSICICDDGWSGVMCSHCDTDLTCENRFRPSMKDQNGSFFCDHSLYSFNQLQNKVYDCQATDVGILSMFGKIYSTIYCPNVTTEKNGTCQQQVWTREGSPTIKKGYQSQIFWCTYADCLQSVDKGPDGELVVSYFCSHTTRCSCTGHYPCDIFMQDLFDRMKGFAKFICDNSTGKCHVEQQELPFLMYMNCTASECLFVPTNTTPPVPPPPEPPTPRDYTQLIIVSSIITASFVAMLISTILYYIYTRIQMTSIYKFWLQINGDNEDRGSDFYFSNISYKLSKQTTILRGVSAYVKKGTMLAIMGASGAGKTTLLDILAGRTKSGTIEGDIFVNGKVINSTYQLMKGYVLQDPLFMDTMTVLEAVMLSAQLRLPERVPYSEKLKRVHKALKDLNISHISNHKIGSPLKRGISGGEMKRVAIACELVISPRILFLDEPTSGLDSYNAYHLIKTLNQLSRQGHTIIFSIHQPNASIFSLFDNLLLLSEGRVAYEGPASKALNHFTNVLKYEKTDDYSVPDFLIDILVKATLKQRENKKLPQSLQDPIHNELDFIINKRIQSTPIYELPSSLPKIDSSTSKVDITNQKTTPTVYHQQSGSKLRYGSNITEETTKNLLKNYQNPDIDDDDDDDNDVEDVDVRKVIPNNDRNYSSNMVRTPTQSHFSQKGTGYSARKASQIGTYPTSFFHQFYILSIRAFKNFIRNPFLMPIHVILCIAAGLILGGIYWQLPLDFYGVQNRIGSTFFICILLGFGAMSSLELFVTERAVYVRELGSGYYRSWAYFFSKIIFDVFPLRVIPPLLLGSISYWMMGFRNDGYYFAWFLILIVLYNIVSGMLCIAIGSVVTSVALGNLITLALNLHFMLFGGFLVNTSNLPETLSFLKYTSPYQFVLEALLCNELSERLVLFNARGYPHFYMKGEQILIQFGFSADHFPLDIGLLVAMVIIFLVLAGALLNFFVKEKR